MKKSKGSRGVRTGVANGKKIAHLWTARPPSFGKADGKPHLLTASVMVATTGP